MTEKQPFSFYQKPKFILLLILVTFFLKGVFLASLLPIFQGPDEQTHYATIQFHSEPADKTWPIVKNSKISKDERNISTSNFSEELTLAAQANKFDDIYARKLNTQDFSINSPLGANEENIASGTLNKNVTTYPAAITNYPPLYHEILGPVFEKFLSGSDIFVRFFSIRIFSAFLGTLIILLSFLIFKNIGFSKKYSLLLSAILAFQPQFSATAAIINPDILLIFTFSLFTLGAVLILKNKLNWKNSLILLITMALGLATKYTAVTLVVIFIPLLLYAIFKKFNPSKKIFLLGIAIFLIIFSAIAFFALPQGYLTKITKSNSISHFNSPFESIAKYASKTLNVSTFKNTLASYWGNFGWLDNPLPGKALSVIWYLEILGIIGTVLFLKRKTVSNFLPEKKYIVLFIFMLVSLQLAIRFADWRIFDHKGSIVLGQPGRYFLPNIIAHFAILFVGLGTFLKKKEWFEIMLKTALVAMVLLQFYAIFELIIPRYYL